MNKYLVVIKEKFVRSDIADNDYIIDYYNDNLEPGKYEWDISNGEFVIGTYTCKNDEDAIEQAAEDFSINKKALKTYKLA